jgi:phosphatidylglycerol:prolipoprotein diacylglycerol transferase
VLYLRRKGIPLAYIADASAVGAVGGLLIWQIRQFLIGLDYGAPTGMPWGLNQWGVMRHPVQLYGAVVLAAILWFLWRYVNAAMPGEPFWLAVALLGLETLLLDVFRADPDTTWGGIRIGQVIALATLVAALYVLSFYRRQPIEAAEAE